MRVSIPKHILLKGSIWILYIDEININVQCWSTKRWYDGFYHVNGIVGENMHIVTIGKNTILLRLHVIHKYFDGTEFLLYDKDVLFMKKN